MPHQAHFVLRSDRQVPEGLVLYLHHHAAALVLKKVTVLAGDLFQDMAFQNTGGIIPGIEHEVSCYRYADRPEAGWLANVHPGEGGKTHE